jgi:hypothetical protein
LDVTGDAPVTTWEQGEVGGMGIYVYGDRAYLAAGEDGLYIFGLTNPDQPELLGRTKTAGAAWDVWAHDCRAYVADVDQGLTVFDVSSAAHPLRLGFVTWDEASPCAEIVRGEGNAVYVAAACHGLIAVDVSDPADPVLASICALAPDSWAEGLAVRGRASHIWPWGTSVTEERTGCTSSTLTTRVRFRPSASSAFPTG